MSGAEEDALFRLGQWDGLERLWSRVFGRNGVIVFGKMGRGDVKEVWSEIESFVQEWDWIFGELSGL